MTDSTSTSPATKYKHSLAAWLSAIFVFVFVWLAVSNVAVVLLGVLAAMVLGMFGLTGKDVTNTVLIACHVLGAMFAFSIARKTWLAAAKVAPPKSETSHR